jgi:hypothetical protein
VPRILRITVPVIAAGLLLAGCGGSKGVTSGQPGGSTPAATTAAGSPAADKAGASSAKPPGSKVIVDKKYGYQVALPSGFVRITSKSQLNKITKAGAAAVKNDGLSQQLLNKQLKMMAIDPNDDRSINVVVNPSGGATADQLPDAVPALKAQVKKLGARDITFKKATLGVEPALPVKVRQ